MKKIIDVPTIGDKRFKRWTKVVTSVDTNKQNGYAFEGYFINEKVELEIGAYILAYGESGSTKYHNPKVKLYQVSNEELNLIFEEENLSFKWALEVRDKIAVIINSKKEESINNIIRQAVKAACEILDIRFSGYECGGINSQIAYSIQKEIERQLIEHNLIKETELF